MRGGLLSWKNCVQTYSDGRCGTRETASNSKNLSSALFHRDTVAKKMATQEIVEAQRLVEKWLAAHAKE